MLKDYLTPLERMSLYNAGSPVDRLPCVPIIGNTSARVIGVKVSDFRNNAKLIAKAQIEAYKKFGYDVIRVFTDLFVQGEAMGATVIYPEDETAYLGEPAINDFKEIDKLKPADPYKDGSLPVHLEALKIVLDAVGKEVSVTGAVICPFTNASFLIGAENLTRLIFKNPEAVHKLCAVSLETAINYAGAIIKIGGTPSLTDAMSSSTVISPKQFKEFSFPYLRKLIDFIHNKGKKVTLHICGKTSPIWELMVEAGADCLSIDNDADLFEAKNKVGNKVRLMGNVKPAETMLEGKPSDIKYAVLNCMLKAFDNPKGFIVASGCSLPTETPFINIETMLDTVRLAGGVLNKEKLERMIYDTIT